MYVPIIKMASFLSKVQLLLVPSKLCKLAKLSLWADTLTSGEFIGVSRQSLHYRVVCEKKRQKKGRFRAVVDFKLETVV